MLRSPKPKYQQIHVWQELTFQFSDGHLFICAHMEEKVRKFSHVSPPPQTGTLIPLMRTSSSWPNYLPKAPPLNTIILRIKIQCINLGQTYTFYSRWLKEKCHRVSDTEHILKLYDKGYPWRQGLWPEVPKVLKRQINNQSSGYADQVYKPYFLYLLPLHLIRWLGLPPLTSSHIVFFC